MYKYVSLLFICVYNLGNINVAEEVKIVDVAGGPAAEATLQELLKVMKAGGSGGGSGGTASSTKAQDLYTTAVTRGTTTRKENTKEVKKSTEAVKSFSSGINGAMGIALKGFTGTIGIAAGLITNFGNAVASSSSISEFMTAVPVFGATLSKVSGYFDKSLDTFRQLSEQGAGFGNNMMAMKLAAAQSGLSLDQFASVIGSNSDRMNLLGGTTSDGAKRFGQLSKTLRSSNSGLMALGMTQESINEGLIDYMDSQALAGQLRGRTDASLAAGAQSYMMELDKLSRMTGKSRKELQAGITTNAQSAEMQSIRATLSGKALEYFDANLVHVSSMLPGFSGVFQDLSDGVAQSDFAGRLASAVPEFAQLAEANRRGEVSQEEFTKRMAELAPEISSFITSMDTASITQLREAGYGEMIDSVHEMTTYSQRQIEAQKAAAAQLKSDKLTKPFADFGQVIQTIRGNIETALIESGIMETLGTVMTSLSGVMTEVVRGFTEHFIGVATDDGFKQGVGGFKEKIEEMGEKAKTFVLYLKTDEFKAKIDSFILSLKNAWIQVKSFGKDISEFGFIGAISKMLGGDGTETIGDMVKRKIGEGLSSMWDNAGLGVKIGAGLLALFTGAKVIGAVTGGIGKMFGGLFGGGAADGGVKGPSGGKSAGKGIANFAGNVGGGILSGIAKGLSAFASPQVALGGAALAGVIITIGAAVAGATWLVGKSLPTFAEGMKAFETLDGAKLSAAGAGMVAVAGGMAAFGAGSAVAGLGNLVGGIADGIGAMFGVDKANPLEQLLEFQKYTIDEAKVKGNANALVAYSTAMAAYGGGMAASGLGSLVSGLASGITSFFGGETGIPYDDIIKFQGYAFDTEKVKANAAAMVAFNEALTSSSSAGASSGVGNAVGAIGDAIAGFFGGKTPFEKVQEFGAMQLNAEGVKVNAQAMADFANALNAFTGGEAGEINVPRNTVDSLQRLSEMGSTGGLAKFATDLNSVATVQGLASNVNLLNSLDADGVTLYNRAMEKLVETLENLNKVLAEDNSGTFGGGTGVSAASMMESGALGGSGSSGVGSSDQLNTLIDKIDTLITAQNTGNRYTKAIVPAVGGNLQLG